MNKGFINNNINKWNAYRIGNYVKGKITLIKDYGIILEIAS